MLPRLSAAIQVYRRERRSSFAADARRKKRNGIEERRHGGRDACDAWSDIDLSAL
jgi:hypothetical protein